MIHGKWLPLIGFLIFVLLPKWAPAGVSINVPIGHWSYGAIDKLTSLGLVQSEMRGTKPFTRLEMARLIQEAQAQFRKTRDPSGVSALTIRVEIIRAVLDRLKKEFRADLKGLGGDDGTAGYVKPLEDVYVKYLYGDKDFGIENDKGQEFADGSNLRAGFSTHGVLFGHFGYYLNPEYRYSKGRFGGGNDRISLLEGYGKLEWFNIELEAGRDSLWWGPGRHGSLLLTDNAQPFDLIKLSNPMPTVLPWIFKHLGLFKFVACWTQLERDRVVPEAEILGFRVHMKPFPFLDIGVSRTIMLGGEGRKGATDLGLRDWGRVLGGKNIAGPLDTNQIGGADFELHFPNMDRWVPKLKSMDLWGEWYGEDQAGLLPSKAGFVAGLRLGDILLTGRTDLILEYAVNAITGMPGVWYGHSIFGTGYRYEGEIIGHNMGGDAREYFLRLEHYLFSDLMLGMDYNRQQRGVEAEVQEDRDRLDLDLTWQRSDTLLLKAGYRFETIDNLGQVQAKDQNNHILSILLNYSF